MNSLTDQQLLRDYTGLRSEAAFAELVRRHVDFVYSAALRMVHDAHLAEDVTQGVFVALAQNAWQLTDRPVLSGWLHRTAHNLAANAVRCDVRRRAREQEAAAMNELLAAEPDALWEHIAPHLDAALGELSEADRDALLLRYFERKSVREMAQTLGVSDEAAQKRVSRAVERLREFFAKRGITVEASGMVVVVSANAVLAAPVGLAVTISTAAILTGTTITATKAIAMTTLQKTLVTATIVAAVGTGIYETRQASTLRSQVQTLQQQQAPLAEQIQQLTRDRDDATRQLAALRDENERLNRNTTELLKLRSEVTRLRGDASQSNDPFVQTALKWKAKEAKLKQLFDERPDQRVPEMRLLTDRQWFDIARDADLDSVGGIRKALSEVRKAAKNDFAPIMSKALNEFLDANNGRLPDDLSEIRPYFKTPVDDAILQQYKLLHTGNLRDLPGGVFLVADKQVVDEQNDKPLSIGPNAYGMIESSDASVAAESVADGMQQLSAVLEAFAAANNGKTPTELDQLKPFTTTPEQRAALDRLIKAGVNLGQPK